jgi:hypothetical protein
MKEIDKPQFGPSRYLKTGCQICQRLVVGMKMSIWKETTHQQMCHTFPWRYSRREQPLLTGLWVDECSISGMTVRQSLLKFRFPFVKGTGELIWDFRPLLSEPTLEAMRTATATSQRVLASHQCANLIKSGEKRTSFLWLPHTCSQFFFSSY